MASVPYGNSFLSRGLGNGRTVTPFTGFTPIPIELKTKGHRHEPIGDAWYEADNTVWVLYEVDEVLPGEEKNPGLQRAVEAVKGFLET
jgi:hypothetical protein